MFQACSVASTTFQGYTLRVFRQVRCRVMTRLLHQPTIWFVPHKRVVGVFLGERMALPTVAQLQAAQIAQQAPTMLETSSRGCSLLGQWMPVEVMPYAGIQSYERCPTHIQLYCRRAVDERVVAQLLAQLQREALEALVPRLMARWAAKLPQHPTSIQVAKLATHTLGLCSQMGAIQLSERLAVCPEAVIEAVLVHECVHLSVFNHSPLFYRMLFALLPDWLSRDVYHRL